MTRLESSCSLEFVEKDASSNVNNQKYVGRIEKVLVDGPSKKNSDVFSGYTESQKLVNFTCDKNVQVGDIIEVEIIEAKSWTLTGKQV